MQDGMNRVALKEEVGAGGAFVQDGMMNMVSDQINDFGPAIGTFFWGSGWLGSTVLKCAGGVCSVWGRMS